MAKCSPAPAPGPPRRSKKQTVLNEFLGRAEKLNADPDAVNFVEQVWLFGSVMREEPTVNDIDIALITSRRPEYVQNYQAMCDRIQLLANRPDVPESRRAQFVWNIEAWLLERALYGPRRHPLLSGVHEGKGDLIAVAAPCRLIFDRAQGGRVSEPILPHYPAADERSADLAPPSVMPDLAAAALRPMDARWVTGFDRRGTVSPYDIFRGWTDEAHQLFPRYPEGLRVVCDAHEFGDFFWKPKQLNNGGLDGRRAVALVKASAFSGTSIILERRLDLGGTAWTLCAEFDKVELYRARKYADMSTLPDLAAAAALILAVDGERLLRRGAEQHSPPPIVTIQFAREAADDGLRRYLINETCQLLKERRVRIEPTDWSGSPVAVQVR